jgi:hypothetical protein
MWPESASELYRPSDRRLSAKLVPTLWFQTHYFSENLVLKAYILFNLQDVERWVVRETLLKHPALPVEVTLNINFSQIKLNVIPILWHMNMNKFT